MTEKAENILEAALELFVEKGFDGTSTIEIARKANVSEALIFRHFRSKAGLLEAIVLKGQDILSKPVINVLNEKDPNKILEGALNLPLAFYADKSRYWKLLMDFKSKNKKVDELMHKIDLFDRLIKKIKVAFEDLAFEEAEMETNLLYFFIVGISKSIFEEGKYDVCEQTVQFLKKKYKLIN